MKIHLASKKPEIYAVLLMVCFMACGPGKSAAIDAMARADVYDRKMKSLNVPNEKTISFRVHYKKAREAMGKGKYSTVNREADEASSEAEKLLKKREEYGNEIRFRLERLRMSLESQPRPRRNIVEGYFDALELLQNNEYEKAALKLAEVETRALRDVRYTRAKGVIIQATEEYYEKHDTIPVYESISEDGEPGNVVFNLKNAVSASFLGTKYYNRDTIFVHVKIQTERIKVEGWVEQRFID